MTRQAGKQTEESKKPSCIYSPAFLDKVTEGAPVGLLLTPPPSPKISAPFAWPLQLSLVLWGPAVSLPFEGG